MPYEPTLEEQDCDNCGAEDIEPQLNVHRDPRTGRDRKQYICPECGMPNGVSGGGKFA